MLELDLESRMGFLQRCYCKSQGNMLKLLQGVHQGCSGDVGQVNLLVLSAKGGDGDHQGRQPKAPPGQTTALGDGVTKECSWSV